MEDDEERETGSRASHRDQRSEPVIRSRWTPKPEQILILESIFNSGMVNPPKDETIRIRKLLEKFGPVGDANVFYWFQNRRSRSRRRQRQMQAAAEQPRSSSAGGGLVTPNIDNSLSSPPVGCQGSSSSLVFSGNDAVSRDFFSFSGQELEQDSSHLGPQETCNLHNQSGVITVFINGIATEVGKGPLDMKAMFGDGGLMLFHSSGLAVEVNDHGFLLQGLQHGESYFLVPRRS